MTTGRPPRDELRDLLRSMEEGSISADGIDRIDELVRSDEKLLRCYIEHVRLASDLRFGPSNERVHDVMSRLFDANRELPPAPPIVIDLSPVGPSPLFTLHSPVGGFLFSYLTATLILGVGLLVGWTWRISHEQHTVLSPAGQAAPVVGRITGLVDCRWANPLEKSASGPASAGDPVPLGRRYALGSGFLEIAYDSGARIILQGPATYEVESKTGGFLSLGKLTARVESRESRVERSESEGERTANPTLFGHQPKVGREMGPTTSLALRPSPLFSIRTPTAVVTDLGTEFGVEVGADGATESHVIRGTVDVKTLDSAGGPPRHTRVTAGSAVRVEPKSPVIAAISYAAQRFTRQLGPPADLPAEAAYIRAVLADKPLGYWPLNEPAGARRFLDRSGNNLHGAAMGAVRAGLRGPLGGPSRAVALMGDGYIDLGRQDCLALANGFSTEAWVWWDSPPPSAPIISAGNGKVRYQDSGWAMGCTSLEGAPNDSVRYGYFEPLGIKTLKSRTLTIPPVCWTHFVCAFGADNVVRAYVDGEPRATMQAPGPARIGPTWGSIGWESNVGGEYWRGRLAHVAVYPFVLSEQQIQNHYRAAKESANGSANQVKHDAIITPQSRKGDQPIGP